MLKVCGGWRFVVVLLYIIFLFLGDRKEGIFWISFSFWLIIYFWIKLGFYCERKKWLEGLKGKFFFLIFISIEFDYFNFLNIRRLIVFLKNMFFYVSFL